MELVYQSRDEARVKEVIALLENNGIPAFTTNENTNSIRKWSMGGLKVFIHINEQRDEAIKLINNPNYTVKNKVDMAHFVKIANRTSATNVNNFIIETLLKGLGFLLVLSIIVYAITTKT